MIKIQEAIIVEGRYDKCKLKQIIDTTVIETSGFGIFKQAELRSLLIQLADRTGIVILTDSDAAGFVIRNHLKGILPKEKVKHAYIPQIEGKERRKTHKSKEGILGVEGVTEIVIIDALRRAGVTFCGTSDAIQRGCVTKSDFYEDGLSGGKQSSILRQKLIKNLNFPTYMTSNALLDAINILLTRDEYKSIIKEIKGKS